MKESRHYNLGPQYFGRQAAVGWHGSPIMELTSGAPLLCCQGHLTPACHHKIYRGRVIGGAGPSLERLRLPRRVLQLRSLTGSRLRTPPLSRPRYEWDRSQLCRFAHPGPDTGQTLTLGLTLSSNPTQLSVRPHLVLDRGTALAVPRQALVWWNTQSCLMLHIFVVFDVQRLLGLLRIHNKLCGDQTLAMVSC